MTRGRPGLFWAAFALVAVSGGAILVAVRTFFDTLTPLWVSMACSVAALILGVLALTLPGRSGE